MPEKCRTEEFQVSGEKVIEKIKELVHEGNIRRIIIKNDHGSTLIEIPLTLGVIGAVLLPVWAAIGASVGAAEGERAQPCQIVCNSLLENALHRTRRVPELW